MAKLFNASSKSYDWFKDQVTIWRLFSKMGKESYDESDLILCIEPDHNDTKPSMVLFDEKAWCRTCDWRGDIFDVLEIVSEGKLKGYQAKEWLTKAFKLGNLDTQTKTFKKDKGLNTKELKNDPNLDPEMMIYYGKEDFKEMFRKITEDEAYQVSLHFPAISLSVAKKLYRATNNDKYLFCIPVVYKGRIVDVRQCYPAGYTVDENAKKVLGLKGTWTGHILGLNSVNKDEPIWIVAGEKDLLAAKSKGMNAISITGGELATPVLSELKEFKDYSTFIIFYDNDDAGRKGAWKLSTYIQANMKAFVKRVNHETLSLGHKEDIYDYFNKGGDVSDLYESVDEEYDLLG